jgi:3'-phosphoadenosine 5'-phosphosulfate sulfotransferase (PAPS reductase)/FAD synthetase
MSKQPVRHILGLSGGKDSTALAIFMRQQHPDLPMEYFFCDTHKELQETYDYLDRIEARLGIKINRLSADRGFDHWLEVYGGVLPSPQMRWCTKQMKIKPWRSLLAMMQRSAISAFVQMSIVRVTFRRNQRFSLATRSRNMDW